MCEWSRSCRHSPILLTASPWPVHAESTRLFSRVVYGLVPRVFSQRIRAWGLGLAAPWSPARALFRHGHRPRESRSQVGTAGATHTPATGFAEPRGSLHAPHWSPWVRYGSVLGRRGAVKLPSCQVVCRPLSLSYRQSYRILRGTCHKRVETHEGYHTLSGQSKDPDDSDISLLSTSSPLVLTTSIRSKKHSNIIKNSWTVGPGVRRLGPESGAVLRVRRR